MRTLLYALLIPLASSLLLFACVPAREYRDLQAQHADLSAERNSLLARADSLSRAVDDLKAQNAAQLRRLEVLRRDSLTRGAELQQTRDALTRSRLDYAELEKMQRALVEGNQQETTQLLTELQKARQELLKREDALKELERRNYQRKLELDRVAQQQATAQRTIDSIQRTLTANRAELSQKNTDLLEMQRLLARKDSLSAALKKRVSDALYGFENKGITVQHRNGRVYVLLEEKLMFRSGSWEVDARGAEAIRHLIPVLVQNPDINILVEGHTDDVPMKGSGQILDNWDLSTKRATAIVRVLLSDGKIAPSRITAAGNAEFHPLEAAKTAEARQKNRRTEIILTPRIDELAKALGE